MMADEQLDPDSSSGPSRDLPSTRPPIEIGAESISMGNILERLQVLTQAELTPINVRDIISKVRVNPTRHKSWTREHYLPLLRKHHSSGPCDRKTMDELVSLQGQTAWAMHDHLPQKPSVLSDLGDSLLRRSERLGSLPDADRAIGYYKQALELTPTGHPDICKRLRRLSNAYEIRFQQTSQLSDLDEAISYRESLISLDPLSADDRRSALGDLGSLLLARFRVLGRVEDIERGLALYNKAILLLPDGHPELFSLLHNLSVLYRSRFERFDELADIDRAIDLQNRALSIRNSAGQSDLGGLSQLVGLLRLRFNRLGYSSDIDQAVCFCEQTLLVIPDEHPEKLLYLSNFSLVLESRFQRLGDYADLDKAIISCRKAISLAPDDHTDQLYHINRITELLQLRVHHLSKPEDMDEVVAYGHRSLQISLDDGPKRIACLNQLGQSLRYRFEYHSNPFDIDQSIACFDQALTLAVGKEETGSGMPELLVNLGVALSCRFKYLGHLEDIDRAINCLRQSVDLTPQSAKSIPDQLSELGGFLMARFDQKGELPDITSAVDCLHRAVSIGSEIPLNRASHLQTLAVSLVCRYESTGHISDLNAAITRYKEALQLLDDRHSIKPITLNGLGNALSLRFDCLETLSDIDEAIFFYIRSISLTPASHSKWAARRVNAASALIGRFSHLGQAEDLNKAIQYQEEGVACTPDDDASKHIFYNSLGNSLLYRFELSRVTADIDRAIFCFRSALEIVFDGHSYRPRILVGLAASLQLRFTVLQDVDDIDQAIECSTQAMLLTPDEHSKYRKYHQLATIYATRFSYLKTQSDLDQAIAYETQALVLAPSDHQFEPTGLLFLGDLQIRQLACTKDPQALLHAATSYRRAAALPTGPLSLRLRAACKWARLTSEPLEAYQIAINLLPQVLWIGLSVQRRYDILSSTENVAVEAAAAAIHFQKLEKALEWLEEGRSIIWKQLSNLRVPLDELRAADPALADRLETVARHLDRVEVPQFSGFDEDGPLSPERVSQQHRQYAQEWERLLEQARMHPSFHDFLQPIGASRILQAAQSGPVILINVASTSCDALVLLPGSNAIGHVPLPDFSLQKARHARSQLADLLRAQGLTTRGVRNDCSKRGNVFQSILALLWYDVVKPVLDHLGYTSPVPIEHRPHVTWCTTGPLAFLPLHAAGLYTEPDSRVYNYVVSSYTPSLCALLTARQNSGEFRGILAVGQADTAGQARLPGTIAELAHLKKHAEGLQFTQLDGEAVTEDRVLAEMEANSWVHLACHAVQNTTNPTKSAFLLGGSTLDLATIMGRSFKKGGLAYLSACQTATGDEKLPEEAAHLAAGMMIAGYSTVIATMWSIKDADAPVVANRVYGGLIEGGTADSRRAARALHAAVAELRDKVGENQFARWVPYIHIGV